MATKDDELRLQFYAEFDEKHGIKQVDDLFEYISKRQIEILRDSKNTPLFDSKSTIKEIVKIKKEYYKVAYELGKTREGKPSVGIASSLADSAFRRDIEAFKATSKDLKEIVGADVKAQVEKRIQLEKQKRLQNEIFAKAKIEAHGNKENTDVFSTSTLISSPTFAPRSPTSEK